MRSNKLAIIFALFLGTITSQTSFASFDVAANLGLYGGALGYGARVGYKTVPNFGLGLSYLGTTGVGLIMADGTFNINDSFYAGGMLGLAIINVSISLGSLSTAVSGATIALGGRTGYDFNIASGLTLGPELRLFFLPGFTYAALANIKYSF